MLHRSHTITVNPYPWHQPEWGTSLINHHCCLLPGPLPMMRWPSSPTMICTTPLDPTLRLCTGSPTQDRLAASSMASLIGCMKVCVWMWFKGNSVERWPFFFLYLGSYKFTVWLSYFWTCFMVILLLHVLFPPHSCFF